MSRINFGSGQFPTPGWINVDNDPRAPADVRHDLEQMPFPFASAFADEIAAFHVLEHLTRPFDAMAEFCRILKPGGTLVVRVPHCSRGFTHPDHKCAFDVSFPLYFQPTFRGGYSGISLTAISTRLRWLAQPELKSETVGRSLILPATLVGAVIDAVANAAPFFCSKVWCYWVGGFDEIEFVFRRPLESSEHPTSLKQPRS